MGLVRHDLAREQRSDGEVRHPVGRCCGGHRDGSPSNAPVETAAVVHAHDERTLPVEAKCRSALGEARVIGVDPCFTEGGVLQAPIRLHQESKFRGEISRWDVEVEPVPRIVRALGTEVPRGGPVAAVGGLSDATVTGTTVQG